MEITNQSVVAFPGHTPRFVFELFVMIHQKLTTGVWSADKWIIRNKIIKASPIGPNMPNLIDLKTDKIRHYGMFIYSSAPDIKLYLEEIRYYDGAGLTVGESANIVKPGSLSFSENHNPPISALYKLITEVSPTTT